MNEKIIKNYSHDYRDMKLSEEELERMLTNFLTAIKAAESLITLTPPQQTLDEKNKETPQRILALLLSLRRKEIRQT